MEDIVNIIREINPYVEFLESTNLIEEGVLDSMGIMFLVASLEAYYDIEISGEHIILDNFVNIESIGNLVKKLKNQGRSN